MDRRTFLKTLPALTVLAGTATSFAQDADKPSNSEIDANSVSGFIGDLKPIVLVKPQMTGGKSVLEAIKERRTSRSVSSESLSPQALSDLLWAAFGVNRDNGPFTRPGRTAASASNSQEIDLYVALPEGIYLYEAVAHHLSPVVAGDFRSKAGRRGASQAPVNIIFVADIEKYSKAPFQEPGLIDPEIQKSYYNVATGLIAGNVYLFAASQGLAAWFHNCDKKGLAEVLKLRPEQRVLYAQTVGYPA